MSIHRFLSLSILSVLAIAGGLFVADRRVGLDTHSGLQPIQTGDALQLGVLLTHKSALVDRNQMIINALFRLQDRVNQCGGVNQAPVFWSMQMPKSEGIADSLVLESLAMKALVWRQRVHGAIAVFTDSPVSHALDSDALNVAIEAEIPIISPMNSQFLVAQAGRFEPFRRDRPIISTQPRYWVRTMPSDRQQLTAIGQWLQHHEWTQVITVIPNTPRGDYLARLLGNGITSAGNEAAEVNVIRYNLEAVEIGAAAIEPEPSPDHDTTPDNPDGTVAAGDPGAAGTDTHPNADPNAGANTAVEPDSLVAVMAEINGLQETNSARSKVEKEVEWLATFDPAGWVAQPPDAVVLNLDADLSIPAIVTFMEELTAWVDPFQVPIILSNDADSLWPLWSDQQESDRSEQATPHPLAGLYGMTPHISALARQQVRRYGLPTPDWRSPPSVFHAWDGAALMMLAAESAGINDRQAIESALRSVANSPGTEVTDVCQGLALLRMGKAINYQGISGNVTIDQGGNGNPISQLDLWQVGTEGDRQLIETFDW
ncbi:MAG: ABC transporter substrate-binding protein [Leptolyngbyaceae cyanobacterium]